MSALNTLPNTTRALWQIHFCVLLWGFTAILGKLITLPDMVVAGADEPPPVPQLGSATLVTRESMQLSEVEASSRVAQPLRMVAAQAMRVSFAIFMRFNPAGHPAKGRHFSWRVALSQGQAC